MEQLAAIILQHTNSLLDKIRVYEIKMQGAKAQSQLREVIQIGLHVLQLLGVEFPPLTPANIEQELQQTQMAIQEHSIPSLLDLGVITDPIKTGSNADFSSNGSICLSSCSFADAIANL